VDVRQLDLSGWLQATKQGNLARGTEKKDTKANVSILNGIGSAQMSHCGFSP
jgi:hypothetical protein